MRILLIEDSDTDAELLKFELMQHWPAVVIDLVRNRDEFDAWIAVHQPPAAILCDSRLPALHGSEALTILRQVLPKVPFLFCAGALEGDPLLEQALPLADGAIDKNRMWTLVPALKAALGESA